MLQTGRVVVRHCKGSKENEFKPKTFALENKMFFLLVGVFTHRNHNNGKESPGGSFTKFTAHRFKKYLQATNPSLLILSVGVFTHRNQETKLGEYPHLWLIF